MKQPLPGIVSLLLTLSAGAAHGQTELALADAVRRAEEASPELTQATARLKQARARIGQAWSRLGPTLTGQLRYTHFDQRVAFSFGDFIAELGQAVPEGLGETVIQEQDQWDASATVSLPLLNLRALPAIDNVQDAERIDVLRRRAAQEAIGHATAELYLATQLAQRAVVLSEEDVAAARRHLRAAAGRSAAGTGGRLDRTRAEAELLGAEAELDGRRRAVQGTLLALATLFGETTPGFIVPDAVPQVELPAPAEASAQELMRLTAGHDEGLEIAGIAEEMAGRDVDELLLQLAPALSLNGNTSWSNAEGFGGETTRWNVMVMADWTPFLGGLRVFQHDERVARITEATAGREAGRRARLTAIVAARQAALDAAAQADWASRQAALAVEALDAAEKSYAAGVATSSDLIDVRRLARQGALSALLSEVRVASARLALRRALSLPPTAIP